jgi:hypothetical protein
LNLELLDNIILFSRESTGKSVGFVRFPVLSRPVIRAFPSRPPVPESTGKRAFPRVFPSRAHLWYLIYLIDPGTRSSKKHLSERARRQKAIGISQRSEELSLYNLI